MSASCTFATRATRTPRPRSTPRRAPRTAWRPGSLPAASLTASRESRNSCGRRVWVLAAGCGSPSPHCISSSGSTSTRQRTTPHTRPKPQRTPASRPTSSRQPHRGLNSRRSATRPRTSSYGPRLSVSTGLLWVWLGRISRCYRSREQGLSRVTSRFCRTSRQVTTLSCTLSPSRRTLPTFACASRSEGSPRFAASSTSHSAQRAQSSTPSASKLSWKTLRLSRA
ncbi:hypothetical protein VHUM_00616 [Vanrija humicola]|uniref:Uncharacterized protein n=1 Tax=Vanrija humicola TaxID=5417 RepID=A0A7D8Z2E2_VANHU|nr:hypothetical protein VHUM_00616 [Vanrija humicola]